MSIDETDTYIEEKLACATPDKKTKCAQKASKGA